MEVLGVGGWDGGREGGRVGGRGTHVIYYIARMSSRRREGAPVGCVTGRGRRKRGIRSRSAMKGESARRRRRASLDVIRREGRSRGAALPIGCLLPSMLLVVMLQLASLSSPLPPSAAGLVLPVVVLRTL